MAIDIIDLNEEDLDRLEEKIVADLGATDSSASRIFLPVLGQILPSMTAVDPEEIRSFGSLIDAFRHELKVLKEQGRLSPVLVDYNLLDRLGFILGEYLSVFEELLQTLQRAFDAWQVDRVDPSHVQRMGGILARVRVLVEGVIKDSKRLDRSLDSTLLAVKNAPFGFRLRNLTAWTRRRLDLSGVQALRAGMDSLERGFKALHNQQRAYRSLATAAQRSLSKFQSQPYQIFLSLAEDVQSDLRNIYLHTKIDERNEREQKIPSGKMDLVLKKYLDLPRCLFVFEQYYQALDQALFEESRILKEQASSGELDTEEGRSTVEMWLEARRLETKKLKFMIYRVREFHLRTDPDPYVHTRMGWHDRQLGPEPKETEPLQVLSRALRRLDNLFYRLSEAVHEFERSKTEAQWKENILLVGEIFSAIKELNLQESEEEASSFVNELLIKWSQLDEVCSFNKDDVSYDEFLLRKALLHDRYLVLFENERFREMLRQHLAIRGPFGDPSQRERIESLESNLARFSASQADVDQFLKGARDYLSEIEGQVCGQEEADSTVLEEGRRQCLEFLILFQDFTKKAQPVVLPSSTEGMWRQVMRQLQTLDGAFYRWEQALLLGQREPGEEG